MNQDTLQQIAQVDEKLTILRESWMDSKPRKKSTWMAKIDAALDERSKLLKFPGLKARGFSRVLH